MTNTYVNLSNAYPITKHDVDGEHHHIYFENANELNEGDEINIIDDKKQTYKVNVVKTSSEMLRLKMINGDEVTTLKDSVLKHVEKANKRIILYIDHM